MASVLDRHSPPLSRRRTSRPTRAATTSTYMTAQTTRKMVNKRMKLRSVRALAAEAGLDARAAAERDSEKPAHDAARRAIIAAAESDGFTGSRLVLASAAACC